MSECINKNIGKLIYAFELNQLDDEMRHQFEEHLFQCDYCFERARNFLNPAILLKHDPEIKEHIQNLAEKDTDSKIVPVSRLKSNYWRYIMVAAVIVLVLIIQPWDVEFKSTKEAVAFENLLAIMYFNNLTEPEDKSRLGEITSNLLINDLSESDYVTVVSSQRLFDVLRILGHEGSKSVGKEIATKAAEKAKARYMLTGSVVQTKPVYVITSQLADIKTGNIIATQRVEGQQNEELFSLIDRLSAEIKNDLTLPTAAYNEHDPYACDITSCSIAANQYFLEGMDYYNKDYFREAAEAFKKAIEIDSAYAMAYYWRAIATSGKESQQMIDLAMKNLNKASKKEQMFIQAYASFMVNDVRNEAMEIYRDIIQKYPDEKEAYYRLGLLYRYYTYRQKAIQNFEQALEIDPFFKRAYRDLAHIYSMIGALDKSLETYDKFLSIYPDDAKAYDKRGDTYRKYNKLDEAIIEYKKALEIKPDFVSTLYKLGYVYLFQNNFEKADSCYEVIKSFNTARTIYTAEYYQMFIPLRQGKIDLTQQLFDSLIAEHKIVRYTGGYSDLPHIYMLQGVIYSYKGDMDSTVDYFEKYYDIIKNNQGSPFLRNYEVTIKYAEIGDFERADDLAEEFRYYVGGRYNHIMYYQYLTSAGIIEYFRKNHDRAITHFNEASQWSDYFINGNFKMHYYKAKNHQALGDCENAIREYKEALSRYNTLRLFEMLLEMDCYYNLGLCYEQIGDIDNALKNFRFIIDLWKDADRELKQRFGYEDIKDRISRLETQI